MNEKDISNIVSNIIDKLDIKMTLSLAERISKKVEEKAAGIGVNAVVAITDSGANTVLMHAMDDAFIASRDIALNKAYTVVALKMSTAKLKTLSRPGEELYGIQFTNGGRIVIFGGGDPLEANGKIIGGIGVSGGSESEDTFLSDFGRKAFEEEIKCLTK